MRLWDVIAEELADILEDRGVEPWAVQPDGIGRPSPERTPDVADPPRRRPSTPRPLRACVYCGLPGKRVCVVHADLPALDPFLPSGAMR